MMFLPRTNSFIAMTIVAISLTIFVFGETTTNVVINNEHRSLKMKVKKNGKKNGKKDKRISACNKKLFEGQWAYDCCDGLTFGTDINCINDACIYSEFEIKDDGELGCDVGGLFSASSKIEYDRTTGFCNLLYIAIDDVDNCGGSSEESLFGVKAKINIKYPDLDVTMLLTFSSDGGVLFYNEDNPREARRTQQSDRRSYA
jgi:hypothetical protein